jgi:uncharacterized membrane protein
MHIRNPVEWALARLDATRAIGDAPAAEYWPEAKPGLAPAIMKIEIADLAEAVRAGVRDFGAARTDLIMFCLIYPVIGLFIAAADTHAGLLPLLFPTASGFALVGPFFAVGLYEMSRQREITGNISWLDTFKVIHSPSIGAIAGLGLLLIGLYGVWLVVAMGIYDLTMGPQPPASFWTFVHALFTTSAGWVMIVVGVSVGAVFAVVALMIGVISFPLLLDRPVGFGTAIETSIKAVRRNPVTLGVWGAIVAASLLLGALPCFIGLIVVLPVLGHATWHLYRRITHPAVIRL